LSSRAARSFGICQQKQLKLTVFCSKKLWNKATQITVFCPAAQRKTLDIAKIDCILICRAAKNLGIGNKRNSI
jgi:hypothetical protein